MNVSYHIEKEKLSALLEKLGINPQIRSEALSVSDFVVIAKELESILS